MIDPDIAVDDPKDIPFCFTVCAAHVPDLGIWSDACKTSIFEGWIVIFHQDSSIVLGKIDDNSLQNWIGRIISRGHAKVDRQLVDRVVLFEGTC